MPTWLWDAGAGAVVRGRTDSFGNRNRIPTNAECMADPGLVVHGVQTLLQKGVGGLQALEPLLLPEEKVSVEAPAAKWDLAGDPHPSMEQLCKVPSNSAGVHQLNSVTALPGFPFSAAKAQDV
ncbi:hypothetical protein EK904_004967 [Melospiza melodia maxima]|nr:hypothetical protein EK904_004967 [Melospiza melodia maxima]